MENCNIDLQTMIIYLSKLKKASIKSQAKMLKTHGLSNRHASYIMALSSGNGMTMKDLSDALCVDPANTTRVISALTESGYVTNDCQKPGCRKFNVFLTEKGKQLAQNMHGDIVNSSIEIMNPLTDEEKITFCTLLFKMAKGIDDEK